MTVPLSGNVASLSHVGCLPLIVSLLPQLRGGVGLLLRSAIKVPLLLVQELTASLPLRSQLGHSLPVQVVVEQVLVGQHPQLAHPVEPDQTGLLDLTEQFVGSQQLRQSLLPGHAD
ncbi:hypothetical protein SDC9_208846 [bioreactor metagenome]|uniref:Uncharacterized protein n=1 Tax=bioreactor metagenome TaxID=1076179 RepID=A0A645JD66_9ZZZZ